MGTTTPCYPCAYSQHLLHELLHFENVAAVNSWNEDSKLSWLKDRLTERAQMAIQHLPAAIQAGSDASKAALKEHFEPESRKDRYKAGFQSRRKQRTEGWADYAEDLSILVDRAYPHLEHETKWLSLAQIDNAQVAFGVEQQKPATLDDAVSGRTLRFCDCGSRLCNCGSRLRLWPEVR